VIFFPTKVFIEYALCTKNEQAKNDILKNVKKVVFFQKSEISKRQNGTVLLNLKMALP